jgi:hypothetical protein
MTENAQISGHAQPKAVALSGSCVNVCAAAARRNNAPVSLAGVKRRAMTMASPKNAPTAAPRVNNSSISDGCIPKVYRSARVSAPHMRCIHARPLNSAAMAQMLVPQRAIALQPTRRHAAIPWHHLRRLFRSRLRPAPSGWLRAQSKGPFSRRPWQRHRAQQLPSPRREHGPWLELCSRHPATDVGMGASQALGRSCQRRGPVAGVLQSCCGVTASTNRSRLRIFLVSEREMISPSGSRSTWPFKEIEIPETCRPRGERAGINFVRLYMISYRLTIRWNASSAKSGDAPVWSARSRTDNQRLTLLRPGCGTSPAPLGRPNVT